MTHDEFDKWLKVHGACFTGITSWLNKMDGSDRAGVLSEWFRILSSTPVDDAVAASRAMAADEDKRPKAFDYHPGRVRKVALSYKIDRDHESIRQSPWRPPVDGEPTFACLECRDEGLIPCFHPKTVAELKRANDNERIIEYTISRACTCRAGDEYEKLCGRFDNTDLQCRGRDDNDMLLFYDVNDLDDRAMLIGESIDSKEWDPNA